MEFMGLHVTHETRKPAAFLRHKECFADSTPMYVSNLRECACVHATHDEMSTVRAMSYSFNLQVDVGFSGST